MAQNNSALKTVDLDGLNNQMLIEAYTGFHSKFGSVDKQTSDWVKHNFKGTTIIADRNGNSIEFPVDEIQEGDSLIEEVLARSLSHHLMEFIQGREDGLH